MKHRAVQTLIETKKRIMSYAGYDVLPEVTIVPEGDLFGGTWIISHCYFGRAAREGYEIRRLSSDNEHFPTRQAAIMAARLRAVRTIDIEEVGARHLTPVEASSFEASRQWSTGTRTATGRNGLTFRRLR